MMLDQGHHVTTIVRSKESMLLKLKDGDSYGDRLKIVQASFMEMAHTDLVLLSKDCNYVVSCLGHNMTFRGMYLKDRKLVTEAAKKLTKAMPSSCKFILMGTEGVENPGVDPKRGFLERSIMFLVHYLLPPHADNEKAAAYLRGNQTFHWVIVRPATLVNAEEATGKYNVTEKAVLSPVFGGHVVSRINVAHFMVKLMTESEAFDENMHKMPVVFEPITNDKN